MLYPAFRFTSYFLFLLSIGILSNSCRADKEQRKTEKNSVRVHKSSDPDALNPVTSRGGEALEIQRQLFQRLLDQDPYSEELVPVLAEKVPEAVSLNDSTIRISYRIRQEAHWDNGEPVLGKDVAFTIKAAFCPRIKNERIQPYLQRIRRIQTPEGAPKKIVFICDRYMRVLHSTGAELGIIPDHIFDPKNALKGVSLKAIRRSPDSILRHDGYQKLVERLNVKDKDPEELLKGSGPYTLKKWNSKDRLVLQRKKDWWGDRLKKSPNAYFNAYPDRIVHTILPDHTSAIQALKKEKLDVMDHIPNERFSALKNSSSFQKSFVAGVAPQLGYSYLSLRMRDPILRDRKVRKALAHLVNKKRIREDLAGGEGRFLSGPVHPDKERFYHDSLSPYRYDPQKAKRLLRKAGWKDRNGDGIREQNSKSGKRILKLGFLYNSESNTRKKVGVLLRESAEKAGIKIHLEPAEWSLYTQRLQNGDFQIGIGGFAFPNAPQDPKQLFHSSSTQGGSNYAGFGNARTDSLIDSLRVTMDPQERKPYWHALQEAIHRKVPMIFLQTSVNRIAVHKRFGDIRTSRIVPGFWVPGFRIGEEKAP